MINPNNIKLFKVSCTKCSWQEEITTSSKLPMGGNNPLGKIFGNMLNSPKLPTACPECGAKVVCKEQRLIF